MNDDRMTQENVSLEELFATARAEQPVPGPDLMARILADAAAATAARQLVSEPAVRSSGKLAGFWAALGGWSGAGGLAVATAAGVWIGVAPPASLESLTSAVFGSTETLSLFASDDILGLEG